MLKRCVAEAVGTFGLVFAGTGAIMVDSLSGGELGQVGVGLSFGLAVAAMIYATGHISGAHINPAVTLGLILCRRLPIRELPAYWAFQLGGAALASLVLRGLLGSVADMGATLPSGTQWESLGMEVLLTFFLVLVVMAVVTHARAIGPAAPLAIGATVGLEAMFAGPISGASMNPARSFGPALVGWVWDSHWIYWAAPLLGAAGASALYAWLRGQEDALTPGDTPRKAGSDR